MSFTKGTVRLSKDEEVYLNLDTGEGVDRVMKRLEKFVYYKSNDISFPSYSNEDVHQQIYMLALEGLPNYNPDKGANLLTFLQQHINNRLVNMYKFYSEQKRRAVMHNISRAKFKCKSCGTLFQSSLHGIIKCPSCNKEGEHKDTAKWVKYNIPVVPVSVTSALVSDGDGAETSLLNVISADSASVMTVAKKASSNIEGLHNSIDINKFISIAKTAANKSIIKMIIQGFTYKEIADHLGMKERTVYLEARKLFNEIKTVCSLED